MSGKGEERLPVIPARPCLDDVLALFPVNVDPLARGRLVHFFELILTWNQKINLTGARDQETLLDEHLPDALAMAELVGAGARLLDVGSGGGLPALPFAILRTDCSVVLAESRAKRVAFLRTATRELGLSQVQVLAERVEDRMRGGFTAVSSRATFPPQEWLRRGQALVETPGQVLVFLQSHDRSLLPLPAASRSYVTSRGGHRTVAQFLCST